MALLDNRDIKKYSIASVMSKYEANHDDTCILLGLKSVGDSRGGNFVFSAYSNLVADGVNVIETLTGKWIRIKSDTPIQNTANPYLTKAAMYADQANQLQGYGYLVDGGGAFTYLGTVAGTAADYEGFGGAGGIIEAPLNGLPYNRKNAAWEVAISGDNVNVTDYGAVGDGITPSSEIINTTINTSGNSSIYIGDSTNETFLLEKPIIITQPNKKIVINGNLKVKDGSLIYLTSDVLKDATTIPITNANQFFIVGQQVLIGKDGRSYQQGSNQSRRHCDAVYVTGVTTSNITISQPLSEDHTVAENTRIGHFQSAIIIKASNVHIIFNVFSEIDVNRANQNDQILYPVHFEAGIADGEGTDFGSGIAVNKTLGHTNIKIENPTVRNAPLHSYSLHNVSEFNLINPKSYNVHDKHYLFFFATKGYIDVLYADGSLYEDGIALYDGNEDITIGKVVIKNSANRYGIFMNRFNHKITIHSIYMFNCKTNKFSGVDIYMGKVIIDGNNLAVVAVTDPAINFFNTDIYKTERFYIDSLTIIKHLGRALSLNCYSKDLTFNNLNLEDTDSGIALWKSTRVKILSGYFKNLIGKALIVIDSSELDIYNVLFENTTVSGVSDFPNGVRVNITNCKGIDNNRAGNYLDVTNPIAVKYNFTTPSSATSYILDKIAEGGFARSLINAPIKPTITGATEISGALFQANTNMELVVECVDSIGTVTFYFILR